MVPGIEIDAEIDPGPFDIVSRVDAPVPLVVRVATGDVDSVVNADGDRRRAASWNHGHPDRRASSQTTDGDQDKKDSNRLHSRLPEVPVTNLQNQVEAFASGSRHSRRPATSVADKCEARARGCTLKSSGFNAFARRAVSARRQPTPPSAIRIEHVMQPNQKAIESAACEIAPDAKDAVSAFVG